MTKKEKPNKETKDSWHSDPSNWILGMFYFNREDKRIFPPKRIAQLGWTINFANPVSILVIAAIIALVIVIGEIL
jgi:uncharacterized membrane protein